MYIGRGHKTSSSNIIKREEEEEERKRNGSDRGLFFGGVVAVRDPRKGVGQPTHKTQTAAAGRSAIWPVIQPKTLPN